MAGESGDDHDRNKGLRKMAKLMKKPTIAGDSKNNGEIHSDGRWKEEYRDQ
jgi:hypothetical protein